MDMTLGQQAGKNLCDFAGRWDIRLSVESSRIWYEDASKESMIDYNAFRIKDRVL